VEKIKENLNWGRIYSPINNLTVSEVHVRQKTPKLRCKESFSFVNWISLRQLFPPNDLIVAKFNIDGKQTKLGSLFMSSYRKNLLVLFVVVVDAKPIGSVWSSGFTPALSRLSPCNTCSVGRLRSTKHKRISKFLLCFQMKYAGGCCGLSRPILEFMPDLQTLDPKSLYLYH
jgi:hypothetical protein